MLYQLQNVDLQYRDGKQTKFALKDISLNLPDKGLITILGPSGSGKTSLLYILSGIKKPTSGQVLFKQKNFNLSPEERKDCLGFIFQSSFLINYLNVLENIAIGFDDKARVKEVLDALQIGDLEKRMPYELSGGQKQRVAIARALIHRPVVILADEPTASLDHVAANKIIEILKETSKNYLVVMVTHDNSLIQSSDQVISIWDGQIN